MAEMKEYICKSCGKAIEVPEELETFSCVYCGCTMTKAEFLPPVKDPAQLQEDLDFAQAHLGDCFRNYPDYFKHFNRKEYEDFFFHYCHGCAPAFQAMDRYILGYPQRRDKLIDQFAGQLLEQWERCNEENKRFRWKSRRKRLEFDNKLTLAWFTVPAIQHMDISCGKEFVTEFHRQYMEKYPDNAFYPGTYEEISAGFRKKRFRLF